jgi:hypothetical protein
MSYSGTVITNVYKEGRISDIILMIGKDNNNNNDNINNNNNLSRKILEAYTRDVGRGTIRIDYDSNNSITGDVIEIRGDKSRTVPKSLPESFIILGQRERK